MTVNKYTLVYPNSVFLLRNKKIISRFIVFGNIGWIYLDVPTFLKVTFEHSFFSLVGPRRFSALFGTYKKLIRNAILDCCFGYNVSLELRGVGYKVVLRGNNLLFSLGFSHEVRYELPPRIFVPSVSSKGSSFVLFGFDRQSVENVAAILYSLKKPDSYKGKGICYYKRSPRLKLGKKSHQ